MRALALGAVGALLAFLAPAATANHYDPCTRDLVLGEAVAYVTLSNDPEWAGPFSMWVYQESNGVAGLQRGGANLFGDLDVCQAFPETHDTAIL